MTQFKQDFSETQTKVLEAYLALSMRIGVEGVTLQKVAKEAKVAFGTVRYHFAGDNFSLSQSAVLYVMHRAQQRVEELIQHQRMQPTFNGVEAYVRANFQWIEEKKTHASYLIHYYYLTATGAELALKNEVFLANARTRIRSLIHESVGRGTFSKVNNENELVTQIHAIVLGFAIIALTEGTKDAFKRNREFALSAADRLLGIASQVDGPSSK